MPENDDELREALATIPDIKATKKKHNYETIIDDDNVTVEMEITQADKQLEEEFDQ